MYWADSNGEFLAHELTLDAGIYRVTMAEMCAADIWYLPRVKCCERDRFWDWDRGFVLHELV